MACDDTTVDSNLEAYDTKHSISINPGSPQWWLSKDISLNGGITQAYVNDNSGNPYKNLVDICFNVTNVLDMPSAATGVTVELWVSPPGANLTPVGAKKIKNFFVPKSLLSRNSNSKFCLSSKPQDVIPPLDPWVIDPSNSIENPGVGNTHRCLIARCYPNDDLQSVTPDQGCFHVHTDHGGDTHIAQLNIDIFQAPKEARIRFTPIMTGNSNAEEAEHATLRVVADLNPDQHLIDILTPALQATSGYQRIVRRSPDKFGLQLPDFPNAKVRDNTRLGCLGNILASILKILGLTVSTFEPSYEADVQLQPGQITTFDFTIDPSSSQQGDAHIFHVTHVRPDKKVVGGLTVVAVVV